MTEPDPPPVNASDLIKAALKSGAHPSEIRRTLQEQGIRWRYTYGGIRGGKSEALRRLKQLAKSK